MELERGFRVGHWEVYPLRNVVSRAEASLRLEGKAIQVLLVLAQHPGEVVTRRMLLEQVWADRPVTDEVLSRCVSLLRSTLGDDPKDPAYIQTIPRIGYRLVAHVRPLNGAPGPAADSVAVRPPTPEGPAAVESTAPGAPATGITRRHDMVLPAVLAFVLILAVAALVVDRLRHDTPGAAVPVSATMPARAPDDAIAVLPLRNLSADPDDEYFADGLTDELISRLSGLQGLKVIARTTALGFKGTAEDARSIGQKLGVSHLVTGTVKISDARLRVTVQLVDTGRGIEIASDAYDATIADAFAVQRGMSEVIVAALLPMLQAHGRGALQESDAATPDARAYLLLLRARHLIKRREERSIRRAIGLLEEAVALDPRQAQLYLATAKAHAVLPYYSAEPKEHMFREAERILAAGRDNGAPIGDAAEGLAAFIALGRWDWLKADQSFGRALAAEPSDADLYQWRSEFYASVGRPDLSLTHAIRASELDALSPVVNDRLAVAYLWLDEDERARQLFQDASLLGFGITANPGAYLISLLRAAEYARAAELLHAIQRMLGGPTDWIDPFMAAQADPARRPEVVAALSEVAAAGAIDPRFLFGAWIYLDELDRAMALAEHMAATMRVFDVEFLFARETREFRGHPRFGTLLAAIGIDRYWDAVGWPAWCRRDDSGIACGDPGPAVSSSR